jgi:putative ABC transport system permease protein
VAHLVLARAAGRRRELGVRVALGAGRGRIVRLLTMESVLLAGAAGTAGFFVGRWCLDALLAFAAEQLPPGAAIAPDSSAIWFCVLVSLFSALLAGLLPALRASRIDLQAALKEAGDAAGTALRRNRSVLMVWEVALALVLAAGALLLLRSLRLLHGFDLGFRSERLLTMKVALPETGYPQIAQTMAFYTGLLEQVPSLPTVSSAGVINFLPVQPWSENLNFTIQGREAPPLGHEPGAELRRVSPRYFQAMGIPVLTGRDIGHEDNRADAQRVALLSKEAAVRYFPDESPVGRSIRFGPEGREGGWVTIVGVVGDVRDRGVYRPAPAIIYEPCAHTNFNWKTMSLVVRASAEPEMLTKAIGRLVWERDPDASVFLVKTMEQVVSDSVAGTRLLSRLLSVFSALALALAVVGVYGVMSYLVSQRTHEIGVRMALGARRGQVLRMVLARGLRNALLGVLLGLLLTAMLGVAMRQFVIGIQVFDACTALLAASAVVAVALAATCLPAWRASRIDPLVALHNE